MLAVFKREFRSYFTNPLGFVILAIFYFYSGADFSIFFQSGRAYVEIVVVGIANAAIFIIPAITMRLFSDERRTKTDQILFTAPVKPISIVLGKFFAALSLFAMGLLPTVIFEMIVASYVKVNVFYYLYSLVGILLFAAAVIAIGMFISALTESPIIAIVFSLIVNYLVLTGNLVGLITVPLNAQHWYEKAWAWVAEQLIKLFEMLSFLPVLEGFAQRTFILKDIIFFISMAIAFIFLTERALEKRRWS